MKKIRQLILIILFSFSFPLSVQAIILHETVGSVIFDNEITHMLGAFTASTTGTLRSMRMSVGRASDFTEYDLGALTFGIYQVGGGLDCNTTSQAEYGNATVSNYFLNYLIEGADDLCNCWEATITQGQQYQYYVIGYDEELEHNVNTEIYSVTGTSSDANIQLASELGDLGEGFDNSTRIINFTPDDNSTTTSPVNFTLDAYINDQDVTDIKGIRLSLHNIDQNVLLLGALSPSDIWFLEEDIDEAGFYNFATSTSLGDGNYRLEACIERNYLGGLFVNPFSDISDCQSHQFVVGEETFIGNISQNSFDELEDFYEGMSATTSEALASSCNLLSGNFDVRLCLAYLFIPSGEALHETVQSLKEGVLTRVPWGYLVRTYDIFSGTATSTLPTFTVTIPLSETASTSLFFDPADMIAGGALLMDNIRDPIYNKNLQDVTEPLIRLFIAIFILFFIVKDVSGMITGGGSKKDYDIKDT